MMLGFLDISLDFCFFQNSPCGGVRVQYVASVIRPSGLGSWFSYLLAVDLLADD